MTTSLSQLENDEMIQSSRLPMQENDMEAWLVRRRESRGYAERKVHWQFPDIGEEATSMGARIQAQHPTDEEIVAAIEAIPDEVHVLQVREERALWQEFNDEGGSPSQGDGQGSMQRKRLDKWFAQRDEPEDQQQWKRARMQGEAEQEEWQRSLHDELEDMGVQPNLYGTTGAVEMNPAADGTYKKKKGATAKQEEDWVDRPSEGRMCSPQVTPASSSTGTSTAPIPPPAAKRFAKFTMPTKKS